MNGQSMADTFAHSWPVSEKGSNCSEGQALAQVQVQGSLLGMTIITMLQNSIIDSN